MLTGIHRQMHVKLAHLTAQTLDSVSREESIDLIEDRPGLVLHHKAVLQDISVQGWGWEEPQTAHLLRHERREAAYIAKAQTLQSIEQEGIIRTEDRHPLVECCKTWQIEVIEMPMRHNNALQRWELLQPHRASRTRHHRTFLEGIEQHRIHQKTSGRCLKQPAGMTNQRGAHGAVLLQTCCAYAPAFCNTCWTSCRTSATRKGLVRRGTSVCSRNVRASSLNVSPVRKITRRSRCG